MTLTDTAAIFRFHKEQVEAFGKGSTEALGWTSADAQLQRFEVLAGIADLDQQILLDAGCGHGDLRAYLYTRYPSMTYIGIEQIPELLDRAIEQYANIPETIFLQGDFTSSTLPDADYILACGSLNYRSSDPEFIFKTIEKLFTACRKGFGFNLLSMLHEPHPLIVAYNPQLILDFCQKLTPHVQIIEGYRENDFSIFMYQHRGA
jgi:SAM-dependent methyltransferase